MATLTGKQYKAIAALLSAPNIKQAAILAGVGERTLYRWLAEDEAFKAELRSVEEEAISQATRRLIGSQEPAITRLLSILTGPTTRSGDRIKAARALMEYSTRMLEVRDVEERLTALERQINDDKSP